MIPIPTLKKALASRGIIPPAQDNNGAEHKVDYTGATYLLFVPVGPDPERPQADRSGAACAVSYLFNEIHRVPPRDVFQSPDSLVLMRGAGTALAVAVPWGATVAAGARADSILDIRSFNQPDLHAQVDLEQDDCPAWAAPVAEAARSLRSRGHRLGGANFLFKTDLPEFEGCSSAPALECASELALREIYDLELSERDSWPASRAEGAASLLAEDKHAVLVDGTTPELIPFDLEAAGLRLLLVMDLSDSAGPPDAVNADDAAVRKAAELMASQDFEGVGQLLTPLSDVLDAWSYSVLEAGALGSHRTGSGRSILALVPAKALAPIRSAVLNASKRDGLAPPKFLTTIPVMGARRLAAS